MEIDEKDIMRMEYDGAPPPRDVPPLRIGIAPETTKLENPDPRKPGAHVGPSRLVFANGSSVDASPGVVSELVGTNGESLNSLTWDKYLAWRKTKCRPFDREKLVNGSLTYDGIPLGHELHARILEEIDQGTLEFIGEVAELGELVINCGPTVFFDGERRNKLIDEIGDILFCGAWAMDAWGENPLYGADDLEIVRVEDGSQLEAFANAFIQHSPDVIMKDRHFLSGLGGLVMNLLVHAQTEAGLTANSYKKLRYQRRDQNIPVQVGRILSVFAAVNSILIIANSSVEEALKFNMRKLDARFPEGYKPGVGGGIRTGDGK